MRNYPIRDFSLNVEIYPDFSLYAHSIGMLSKLLQAYTICAIGWADHV